jgi:hypothetical protein
MKMKIDKRLSSLVFLHTASMLPEEQKKAYKQKRYWPYGYPAGDYIITYKDGSKEKLPVRIGENIQLFDVPWWARAVNNCRYEYYLKSNKGDYYFLYQWEWVNPCPEKEISQISWSAYSRKFKSNVFLFAVSGRKIKNKRAEIVRNGITKSDEQKYMSQQQKKLCKFW